MCRQPRIEYAGAFYHLMSHGVDDVPIFIDDYDRKRFLKPLEQLVAIGALIVHAFVLMITHFHILCETPSAGLAVHMQKFLGQYAQGFNHRHDRRGHLLRSRYRALLVEDGEYFLECSRYIHLNPWKAGICLNPEDYRWSSYGQFVGTSDEFNWVCTSRTLDYFPNSREYAGFVMKGRQEELRNPFDQTVGGIVFGSEEFAKSVGVVPAQRAHKRTNLSISTIEDAINQVFPGLSRCQHNRILIYALQSFTNKTRQEIASLTNRVPRTISGISNKIGRQLSTDREMKHRMHALKHLCLKKPPL